MPPAVWRRFWAKVQIDDGCWLWTGGKQSGGYGSFGWQGRSHLAHRIAYELMVGAIPPGLHIDHLCMVKLCVRPAHLEAVTNAENLSRFARHYLRNKWLYPARLHPQRRKAAS